ncbi:Probable serine/threonine-protein kinase kinY [Geodia barretti]|uniref:Probable serine/threonine-protein kinase kinY n=1 Tax=Geodia barretti TaxID=519541 RepID=A0AA35W1U8_GEOBA|nr:Probable serine/threonine-protein kinase kinY [Geodia barretti]
MDVAVSSAENVLHDCPELRPFLLFNARLTGTTIGSGAYGCVEEVAIPGAICAAKKIHNIFHDPAQVPAAAIRKAFNQFVKECQLMSTLRHPNIVQFLGITFFPGSQLPVLVMERLLTSLHDLLEPEVDPLLSASEKQFFPLSLKCSILENVASGLVYLHERSPPVIHRDLSARNVLLNSALVAKIADLGVARIVPRMTVAATMTKAPGAGVYMPPEALEHQPSCERRSKENDQKSKYDASIDVFSYGVVAIFTLCQTFPCNLLAPTYRDKQRKIAGRSELERRESYMSMIRSQLKEGHPLLQMIEGCLDFPEDRPTIHEVLGLLEQARAVIRDKHVDMNKLELVQALHAHSRSQQILEENLYSHVHLLQEKLMKTKVELRKAEEVIGKLQQQNMEGQQLQSSGTWEEQQLRRTRKPHVEVIIQERHLETQGKHCPRKNDAEVATSPRNIRNVRPQKNEETKQLLETGRSYSIQAERQPKEVF